MRVLKTILIILLSLVGLWLLLSLIGPKTSHVERSTVIDAQPGTVYDYAKYLKNMDEWGVWRSMDKDAKYELIGEDGTVGAKQAWDGDTVMQGSMTITALEPNKSVKSDLAFGDFMTSQVELGLQPVEGGTEVKWSLDGEIPFMGRAMMLFMSMDDQVGKDFDTGLANLKRIVEAKEAEAAAALAAKTSGGYVIETLDRPEMVYVGKRNKKVKWQDMGAFFASSFPAAGKAAGEAKLEMAGAPSGVYFEWNEKDQTADLLAGMPVKGTADLKVAGMETVVVPASKVLHIPYYGAYEKVGPAHEAMDAYIKANNLTHYANVIEEYVTDPMTEKDTTKWLTNIYYLVK